MPVLRLRLPLILAEIWIFLYSARKTFTKLHDFVASCEKVPNFSKGADCHSTLNLFKLLDAKAEFIDEKTLSIHR